MAQLSKLSNKIKKSKNGTIFERILDFQNGKDPELYSFVVFSTKEKVERNVEKEYILDALKAIITSEYNKEINFSLSDEEEDVPSKRAFIEKYDNRKFLITNGFYDENTRVFKYAALFENNALEEFVEELEAAQAQPEFAVYVFDYSKYDSYMNDMLMAVEKNGKDYELAYRTGSYNVPNLMFGSILTSLKQLLSEIEHILSNKAEVDTDLIETIGFKINSSFVLTEIQLVFLQRSDTTTIKIPNAARNPLFNIPVVLNFFINAYDISEKMLSNSEDVNNYDQFIQKYYYGATVKRPTNESQDSTQTSYQGSYLEKAPGPDPKGFITTYQENLEEANPSNNFTPKTLKEYEKKISDPNLMAARALNAVNTIDSKDELMLEKLNPILGAAGDLRGVYRVYNSLDKKAIFKILKDSAKQKLALLNPREAEKRMALTLVEKAEAQDLKKIYFKTVLGLPGDSRRVNLSEMFETYWSESFGSDTPIPTFEEDKAQFAVIQNNDLPQTLKTQEDFSPKYLGIPPTPGDEDIPKIRKTFLTMVEGDEEFPTTRFLEVSRFADPSGLTGELIGISDLIASNTTIGTPKGFVEAPYIPKIIPPFPDAGDIKGFAIRKIRQIIEQQITNVLTTLSTKILESLSSAINSTPSGSDRDVSSPDRPSKPEEQIANSLRDASKVPARTNAEAAAEINKILSSYSVFKTTPDIGAPSDEEVQEFIEKVSFALTFDEMLSLYNGTSNASTITKVSDILDNMQSGTMRALLPTDDDIKKAFTALGILINRTALKRRREQDLDPQSQVQVELCATPYQIVKRDKDLRKALQDAGLTEEEIDDEVNKATDAVLESLQEDVEDILSLADAVTGEEDAEELYNQEDEALNEFVSDMFSEIYEGITTSFIQDLLIGNPLARKQKGFLDIILSSVATKEGKSFSKTSAKNRKKEELEYVSNLRSVLLSQEFIEDVSNLSLSFLYDTKRVKYNYGSEIQIQSLDDDSRIVDSETIIVQIPPPSGRVQTFLDTEAGGTVPLTTSNFIGLVKRASVKNTSGISLTDLQSSNLNSFNQRVEDTTRAQYSNFFIKRIIDSLARQSVLLSSQSWIYGTRRLSVTIKDADEEEYGPGAWYQVTSDSYSGWRKIYNESVPPQTPGRRKAPLYNFETEEEETQKFYDTIPEDNRVKLPQKLFEKVDRYPFARANSRMNNSTLAGMILSTIKLNLIDSLIKGMPFFRLYPLQKTSYGLAFSSYVAENIIKEVLQESRRTPFFRWKKLGVNGYYYIFLEQVAQVYSNMVQYGLIQPSDFGQQAIEELLEKLSDWNPDNDSNKAFKQFVDDSLPQIKLMLTDMVFQKLDAAGEEVSRVYKPKFTAEDLFDNFFINSGEVFDVPATLDEENSQISSIEPPTFYSSLGEVISKENTLSSDIEKLEKDLDEAIADKGFDSDKANKVRADLLTKKIELATLQKDASSTESIPFVYQRYLKLSNESGYKIIKKSEYDSFEEKEKYPQVSEGIRVCYYSYADIGTASGARTKVFNRDRTYNFIPLISFEIERSNYNSSKESREAVLLSLLKRTPGYEALLNYCVPISDILSSMTIYTIENFSDSVVKQRSDNRDAGAWNQEVYQNCKKFLKDMTEQSYYAKTPTYAREILNQLGDPVSKMASSFANSVEEDFDIKDFEKDSDEEEKDALGEAVRKLPKWRRNKEVPPPQDS